MHFYICFSCSQFDHCMFSRILTLDLRPYPLTEEENGSQTDRNMQPNMSRALNSFSQESSS